jgi:hypothetical protein
MGDTIVVKVENLDTNQVAPASLVLFLNGQVLKGVTAVPVGAAGDNQLAFRLKRTDESRQTWGSLLGRPDFFGDEKRSANLRYATVSVGNPEGLALPFTDPKHPPAMYLRVYYGVWAVGAAIVLALVIVFFFMLARKGYLIRDNNPPNPPAGQLKPYSLALTQAAWWFFLVIASFILIYLVTGDYNTISDQALVLMGIGTGTALGAAMVNATKRDSSDTELAGLRPEQAKLDAEVKKLTANAADIQARITAGGASPNPVDQLALRDNNVALEETKAKLVETTKKIDDAQAGLTKPVSEGFGKDLLTDVNGITLHRFQMAVWTFMLGVLFIFGVYKELAMPEFSATLLALMGISAGTYLGFKIPEKQN